MWKRELPCKIFLFIPANLGVWHSSPPNAKVKSVLVCAIVVLYRDRFAFAFAVPLLLLGNDVGYSLGGG